jgi:peroxiredoxin
VTAARTKNGGVRRGEAPAPDGASAARDRRLPGRRPLSLSRIERNGLPSGTAAPPFVLPDARGGGDVSLAAFRGRRLLLVFTDPRCAPCDGLAPRLARWQAKHGQHGQHGDGSLAVLLVGRGDPAENRRALDAAGSPIPVAVQRRWEVSRAYGIFTTPAAFLIDASGVIAGGVARGTDEILALADAARGAPDADAPAAP